MERQEMPDKLDFPTPEMIEAGATVLEEFQGEVSRSLLAELVYQAMRQRSGYKAT